MPGQSLGVNQQLISTGGLYRLVMQGDGNLVYYRSNNTARWHASTQGTGAVVATMQTDGNFVVYDANWRAIWHTQTSGHPGAYLTTQPDGNLVIYWNGQAIWHLGQDPETNANGHAAMKPGQGIWANQQLVSASGHYRLVMQGDGNLVYYRSNGTVRWDARTNATGAAVAVMQTDGNFVVYNHNWQPIWHTQTSGHPGAYLAAQDDGNLVIYWNGQAIWHLGEDPENSKPGPRAVGDIVGRDLASGVGGPLGHAGWWDGQNVFQVMNEPQVVQYVTLNGFKAPVAPWQYWGAGYPNIPQYWVRNCVRTDYCNDSDYNAMFDVRSAMVFRARQIHAIGATYTLSNYHVASAPRSRISNAIVGNYRCDTFVFDIYRHGGNMVDAGGWLINIAALPYNNPIKRWANFRDYEMRTSLVAPNTFFQVVKNFGG